MSFEKKDYICDQEVFFFVVVVPVCEYTELRK